MHMNKSEKINIAVLSVFCLILIAGIAAGISTVISLAAGLVLFAVYAFFKGFKAKQLFSMCLDGIKTAKNVLITFLLIGVLTALWRASGCIPAIVHYTSGIIRPSVFIAAAFLLNCLLSVLTGTAFGTAATMGVICMSIAGTMGISPFWTGGAILSGVFFGDRCSPVSTSALLTATLTETKIYSNIKNMLRSCAVPFAAACAVYAAAGFFLKKNGGVTETADIFSSAFTLNPLCLIPAAGVLIPALFRVNVKITMLISIVSAVPVTLFVQKMPVNELLLTMLTGFSPRDEALSSIIGGGGITSMLKVTAIVCIASCYSGIFDKTGLLDFIKKPVGKLAEKRGVYAAVLLVSLPAGMIACNQTLAIMLTHQITKDIPASDEDRALCLEDSAVVTSPLIPWSIASAVPLTSAGAPMISVLAACYLYMLPLWRLIKK